VEPTLEPNLKSPVVCLVKNLDSEQIQKSMQWDDKTISSCSKSKRNQNAYVLIRTDLEKKSIFLHTLFS
jgi:hypothetical protein